MQLENILVLYHSKGDTITLKEWRSFSIFSALLSSKKMIKATQEILHPLLTITEKLFYFAPLFYSSLFVEKWLIVLISFKMKQ